MLYRRLYALLAVKALRTFVFSYISLVIPYYLHYLGYGPIYVGLVLLIIMAGNAASNVALLRISSLLGERTILIMYSALIVISGMMLGAFRSLPMIALAGFMGNISTGTETGPFQSIESSALTRFADQSSRNRAYGVYNFVGFLFTALGALFTSFAGLLMRGPALFSFSFALYAFLGVFLMAMYFALGWPEVRKPALRSASGEARRHIFRLSALFFVDSFGGGFMTQSVLSYWFLIRFRLNIESLGEIFTATNVISSVSIYISSYLSDRIGNVRTMVFTHFASSVFLILFALSPKLGLALSFLFARQTLSQMDVPARQSFIAHMFGEDVRVYAVAITNIFRSLGVVPGPYITGVFLYLGYASAPILTSALSKMGYDLTLYYLYSGYER